MVGSGRVLDGFLGRVLGGFWSVGLSLRGFCVGPRLVLGGSCVCSGVLYLVQLLFWSQPAGVWELLVRARGVALNHPPPWSAPPGGDSGRIPESIKISTCPQDPPKQPK